MNNDKSLIIKLTLHGMLFQAVYWFGFCTYITFMVTTLMDYGWKAGAAAGAITCMSVIVMLVQPFFGYLSDKYFSEKKLSVFLSALAAIFFILLPLSLRSGNTALVLINMLGVSVCGMQVAGLLDAWIVGLKQEFPSINYGLIRGIGSLSFALAAQIAGMTTAAFGHDARLWLGCGSFLSVVFTALTFRSARKIKQTVNEEKQIPALDRKQAIKLIFSSKQYCLLVTVSSFLLLSNGAMLTLIQLLIRGFGGTTAQIGTTTAVMATSEVPLMFLTAFFIGKFGYKKIIIFCCTFYVIRLFITASVLSVNAMIGVQLLQGLTYAVLIPLSMSYLTNIVDERVRSTAIMTFTAITASMTGILGNLITSALLAAGFTAKAALVIFAFSALAGLITALYGCIKKIW